MGKRLQMWISDLKSILLAASQTAGAIYLLFWFGYLPVCSAVHLLLLLLVIRPASGQFFDVPVQLLGDDMTPVNNGTVPLRRTCVVPTELAQRAAYFRGLLLQSSGIHWKPPGFTILVSITSDSPDSLQSLCRRLH